MNFHEIFFKILIFILLLLLLGLGAGKGQTVGAAIHGTITDAGGGVVSNARIEAHNRGSGSTQTVVTDSAGRYRLPLLPSGDEGC
ncbi:MAG TPA: carboxypeptidase-like regulatory domain-containing protein [Blastocatellia bacterium]|nr:carboxypeptidase-like regulatory domain-containing protein [Blastocatellia bacterium]